MVLLEQFQMIGKGGKYLCINIKNIAAAVLEAQVSYKCSQNLARLTQGFHLGRSTALLTPTCLQSSASHHGASTQLLNFALKSTLTRMCASMLIDVSHLTSAPFFSSPPPSQCFLAPKLYQLGRKAPFCNAMPVNL